MLEGEATEAERRLDHCARGDHADDGGDTTRQLMRVKAAAKPTATSGNAIVRASTTEPQAKSLGAGGGSVSLDGEPVRPALAGALPHDPRALARRADRLLPQMRRACGDAVVRAKVGKAMRRDHQTPGILRRPEKAGAE